MSKKTEVHLPLPAAEIPQYANFCCGCARQSTAKTDCCFCHEETDMGVMRHWCSFIKTDCEFVCEKCEYFMSKSEAAKVLKGIVLERNDKTLQKEEEGEDVMNIIDDLPTIGINTWVSIDDMLPNEETYILVSNSQRVTIAYYANRIFIGVQGNPHTLKTVTHWMPLPEPPTEQT